MMSGEGGEVVVVVLGTPWRCFILLSFCSPCFASSEVEWLIPAYHTATAVVSATFPVAVFAVPVWVLAPGVRGPWRLRPPHTLLVLGL